MTRWQKQSAWRRFSQTRIALILVILLAIWLGRSVWQAWQKSRAVITDRQQVEGQLQGLNERQLKLQSEIDSLGTASGLERAIKEKFSVVKPGEKVIVVIATDTPAVAPASGVTWWQKLFGRD